MSEIKYYDGGAGMPDAAFYDGFNRVFAYAGADRSHETDSGILTGVTLTTGYGAIAATASAGTAQQLTTGTLAASTAKYVNVAIASGANSETLLRTLQGAGAALAVEANKAVAAVVEAASGIIELTLNLSRATVLTCLTDLKTAMDEHGAPAEGRVIAMPSTLVGELAKDSAVQGETDIEITGGVTRVMGFDIAVDDELDGEMIAWQKDALAVAAIVDSYTRTSSAVSATLHAGALVVDADGVALVTVS